MPHARAYLLTFVLAALVWTGAAHPASRPSKPLTFSILEDYDKGEDLVEVGRDFDLFRELDLSTWRGSLGWDDYEPEQGTFDYTWLHQFLALAESRRIQLRPYIGYTPDWAAGGEDKDGQPWNQPPRSPSAWRRFVAALAGELRHHRNVTSLEIYNEQNVAQWWEGTPDQYAVTLRGAASAARTAGFREIVLGGLVFPDLEWLEAVCRDRGAASSFQVLPVHAYPETWTPAGVTVENYLGEGFGGGFVSGADRACGRKRIWINETGFATTPGKTELEQAAWWVRAVATFAAAPRVEHIGIYEIKDLRPDRPAIGDAPNYHLGLTRADRTRKLAFSTVDMLTDLLDVGRLTVGDDTVVVRRDGAAGEQHHHVFVRPDEDRVLMIWNRTSDSEAQITLGDTPRAIREYSLDGRVSTLESAELAKLRLERGIPRVFRLDFR